MDLSHADIAMNDRYKLNGDLVLVTVSLSSLVSFGTRVTVLYDGCFASDFAELVYWASNRRGNRIKLLAKLGIFFFVI